MSDRFSIDLGAYLEPSISALVGRKNGKEFLKKLTNKDKSILQNGHVIIKIPEHIITINSSFFQGFLEEIVRQSGSLDDFLSAYKFQTSEHIKEKIEKYASNIFLKATPKEILKAK